MQLDEKELRAILRRELGPRPTALVSEGSVVVVYAKNVERVASFYAAVLEVKSTSQRHVATIKAPAFQLVVCALPNANEGASALASSAQDDTRPTTRSPVVIPVARIAIARITIQQYGGRVDTPDIQTHDAHICRATDPEGNPFSILEAPT